jgi:xanthine dehydrogenase accessory factor
MKKLFENLYERLSSGKPTALVTIISSAGSTPRGTGARMLVGENGRIAGTIGGGTVEYRSMVLATEVIKTGSSYTRSFTLRPGEAEDLGMICGGDVKVSIQYIPASPESIAFTGQVVASFDRNEDAWLILDVTQETPWEMALYTRKGCTAVFGEEKGWFFTNAKAGTLMPLPAHGAVERTVNGRELYSELLVNAGRAVIFGGGHIGQELVPLLTHVGFRCVVYDDRAEFSHPDLFPGAIETICGSFAEIGKYLQLTEQDYVIIVTRGHVADFESLRHALHGPAAYYGCIGSRTKVASVIERLRKDDISQELIDQVHMPIGIQIQGKTPAEIAVSIAAELIQTRAAKTITS